MFAPLLKTSARSAARPERLRCKLAVGRTDDPLETEADRVADQVMRMPAPEAAVTHTPMGSGRRQLHRKRSGVAEPCPADVPPVVDQVLRTPGQPLDAATRAYFEPRFGRDFSRVRVHADPQSSASAQAVQARAYAVGPHVVFGPDQYAPASQTGRRLLAHELAHTVQQEGAGSPTGALLQRTPLYPEAANGRSPDALLDHFEDAMDQNFFGAIAETLAEISRQPGGYAYIREVFEEIDSDWEDNVGAALTERLGETSLDRLAADSVGLETLDLMYAAIITGKVTDFQRKQANRLLYARARRGGAADYLAQAGAANVKVFPLRFARLTDPSENYATPTAKLLPNGRIRVDYPMKTWQSDWFKAEKRTLGDRFFIGDGAELPRGEIVGIKNYESGEPIYFVPAIALVDLANQAHNSTIGKIVDVSLVAASFGFGGAAAGGGRVANVLRRADQVATAIGAAAFVIEEQRHYIVERFPVAGPKLVRYAEVAKGAATIYGVARLGQAGVSLLRDMHRATDAARREVPGGLTAGDAVLLDKLDDQTAALIRQIDAEDAAKAAAAGRTVPAGDKPTTAIEAVETAGARVETVSARGKSDKARAANREREQLKQQAQEDVDAARLDDRGGDRSRDKQRSTKRDADRAAAHSTARALEAQASREAMQLYEQARSGAFTHLHDADKRKLVERFERLMKQAGWSVQKRNPLKGNFDEGLRTPRAAPGQPEYKAGGPRVEGQDRAGTARPDYDTPRPGGTPRRHYNLKGDNLGEMTMAEAVGRAEKNTEQAVKNAKALPGDAPIVLRYGTRPRDEFGPSTAMETAMNAVHFRAGSPIVEVHYGTVAYRR